jgi:acyl-homoserine lactone synthase
VVTVLQGGQRRQYPQYFDRLFRLRHQVFVKGRGWSLPSCDGDREIDQYDVDDAIYFFDLDDNDGIRGSVRMTPTDRYSLLADYFPHLVETGGSVRCPTIYEATRYLVLPTRDRGESVRAAKARLIIAVVEWCLQRKLTHLQAVVDTATFSTFVEMNPLTIPLGLSHPYAGGRSAPGGGECIAFRWPITLEVLEHVRAYAGLCPWERTWSSAAEQRTVLERFLTC